MTDHPLLTWISLIYSLIENPESCKQSSVGQVNYKPQHGYRSKHLKVEYKLVCLQDIMAYDLANYECRTNMEMGNSTNYVYSIK